MSTAAAPSTGSAPGSNGSSRKAVATRDERVSPGGTRHDPDRRDRDAFGQDTHEQLPRRGADRQPHAELARARAHGERQHARDADDRDEQRDAGES